MEPAPDNAFVAAAVHRWRGLWTHPHTLWSRPTGWRLGAPAPTRFTFTDGIRTETVGIFGDGDAPANVPNEVLMVEEFGVSEKAGQLRVVVNGGTHVLWEVEEDDDVD